ncbi:hypothetical protein V1514DRAFT_325144 [Lipomyces japonicus]|uniref:uncharacterized protein n=1 Tax=Lipomyces japonicus TaxID=56871 RepID=UPI0034CDF8EE
MWLEDYCFVCDKVCPSGSIYCSEHCKLEDLKRSQSPSPSPSASPTLLPMYSSYATESRRRSSAIQVQALDSLPGLNISSSISSSHHHHHPHPHNSVVPSSPSHASHGHPHIAQSQDHMRPKNPSSFLFGTR